MDSSESSKPKKLQRISQACDLCHRRSIRCRPSIENAPQQCQNCYDFGVDCTYNRPSRRRRNPSVAAQTSPPNALPLPQPGASVVSPVSDNAKSQQSNPPSTYSTNASTYSTNASNSAGTPGGQPDFSGAFLAVREGRKDDLQDVGWRSFALASQSTIEQLIELYIEIVYPIWPLFHVPSLREKIQQRQYLTDRGFFATIMAACALSAARVRDGAISEKQRYVASPEKASEIFFAAAQDAIGKDFSTATGLGSMRACGILAITAIQYGQIRTMHEYLGKYMTLRAMLQCHDERNWPSDCTLIEREERRRLYWAMYTFDIYTAVVFDGLMWSQETHSNVRYPVEVNDEDLTAEPASPTDDNCWLRGWNFTTDLYRMLEHSVKRMRRNKALHNGHSPVTHLLLSDDIPDMQVMDNVLGAYYQLPARFRALGAPTAGDRSQILFGFQAANIQTTLQLVRMTLFSTDLNNDVDQKSHIADQALSTFHSIAPQYLLGISTPLVYHLGRIGRILASVMEGLLCEQSYQRVRNLLVSMADLLEGLESGLQPTAGASKGLRTQIEKIDRYMHNQRQIFSSVAQQSPAIAPGGGTITTVVRPSQANGLTQQSMSTLGLATPLDEFQLPMDLVNGEAWPWPFEFGAGGGQMPMTMGFQGG
ncbi:hypothetical protein LTR17_007558 [Elasticomyces elasticus]|nr:hypothetical protein LTR17_007558 [Elasticomyces elasticus]